MQIYLFFHIFANNKQKKRRLIESQRFS